MPKHAQPIIYLGAFDDVHRNTKWFPSSAIFPLNRPFPLQLCQFLRRQAAEGAEDFLVVFA